MKDFNYPIKEHLAKGLSLTVNVRNNPYLVEAVGCVPYDGVLKTVESFSRIDTSALGAVFPYPQLFVFSDVVVVCTETALYEYVSPVLTLKIGGLTAGTTWDALDFKTYLYFTNGKVAVIKSPTTGDYSITTDLPFATCCCDYNGQVLIGSPNTPATGAI